MRTTVALGADVAAAVERLRRERSIGASQAVNELVRAGLAAPKRRKRFARKTHDMGETYVDSTDVWKTIEELEGPWAR